MSSELQDADSRRHGRCIHAQVRAAAGSAPIGPDATGRTVFQIIYKTA